MEIVLASSSPQKIDLMRRLYRRFRVIKPEAEENFDINTSIEENLKNISYEKAVSVIKYCREKDIIIIASDTVIFFKRQILRKPSSIKDAERILRLLSGKWHEVLTGYTILLVDGEKKKILRKLIDVSKTLVKMRDISSKELDFYLKTREPMDKAGAYAIQGIGGCFIERINGDFYTVVGLPIARISEILYLWGYWP